MQVTVEDHELFKVVLQILDYYGLNSAMSRAILDGDTKRVAKSEFYAPMYPRVKRLFYSSDDYSDFVHMCHCAAILFGQVEEQRKANILQELAEQKETTDGK